MKRLVVLGLVLALVAAAPVAAAAPRSASGTQAEIDRLREQVDEAAAVEAALLAELQVTRRAKAALEARVGELDRSIATAEAHLAGAEISLREAEDRHGEALRRLEEARAALVDARLTLAAQAVTAFIRFGQDASAHLDVLFDVRDVSDLHAASGLAGAVTRSQVDVVDHLEALEAEHVVLEADAARAEADAVVQRDAVVAHKATLEAARVEQAEALRAVAAEAAREETLVAQARATRGDYERRIAALQAESDSIAALLRRVQAGQDLTVSAPGVLGWPLARPAVTSGFGYRTHPIFGTRRLHAGIDLRGASGTPILAAADGTVVYAGARGGYGTALVIDHGGSLATLYAHQSRLAVGNGARVRRGQVIGSVGSTGFSTGPHLHFEVRVKGTPVDPRNYL